ncbi:hypothetical protein C2I18_03625 [Paenibacillus sp. PK3_47]|uniref:YunG family protein n=1 Tax=Paenibacillus sp. PK3_47 TaxID=2072642 RepID=UPI00201D9EA2|nr:hypothetical protein [Paenibacillus sp. PK3_47]UQZ32725.1 hypothetical protein C2I18_03625 [Paenibacillus sp. PK3_47]
MQQNNKPAVEEVMEALFKSWSLETSSKWSENNPAKGQCGVTALLVNDLLGGEICKTKLPDGWHFYNIINGQRYDFTASQFKGDIVYMDVPSDRAEAYEDTNENQYSHLKQSMLIKLNIHSC